MPDHCTAPAALPSVLPDSPPGGVTAGMDWATVDHAVAVVDARGAVIDRFVVDAADHRPGSSCATSGSAPTCDTERGPNRRSTSASSTRRS